MRKFATGVLAAALCASAMFTVSPAKAAATPAPAIAPAAMPVLPGPLSHKVMEAYMAYVKGDIESIVKLTSDDVEWVGVGPAGRMGAFGTFHGHDGVRHWFAALAAEAGPYSLTNLEFHEDGNTVWVVGQQSTTINQGPMESSPFAHFFKFKNGLITNYWNFLDTATLVDAANAGMAGMPAPLHEMSMGSMTDQNIAAVQAGYAAFGSGDLDKLVTGFTDDITWEAVGPAGVLPIFGKWQGKDQVKQWFMTLGSMTDCEPFRHVQFIASGDTVVAAGWSKVTFKSTGKVVDGPFVHVFKFRDGKIASWQGFEDTAADVMAAK